MMNFYVISFSVTTLIITLIVNRLMNGNSTSMVVLYCFSNSFQSLESIFFLITVIMKRYLHFHWFDK